MRLSRTMAQRTTLAIATLASLPLLGSAASAHHAMDGQLPTNALQGFLSGLAHPILGIDHFAFIVALGLVAAIVRRGQLLPIFFLVTAMVGTGLHLQQVDVPGSELLIAGSVILLGSILGVGKQLSFSWLAILGAIAGLFHGYAYGESIVGAQTTALVSYLVGFTVMQAMIALGVWAIARKTQQVAEQPQFWVRYIGSGICGIGIAALANQILG
ncbi:MAG: HupE/UreJ family protein [Synechococcales bacterium]|nr:HupE/UreJ family protein [Synechococcales bacterium]